MIEQVATFDLNVDILLLEWRRVRELYTGLESNRIRITYSDLDDENIPCNIPYRNSSIRELSKQTQGNITSVLNTWSAKNILKPFQKTYTEQVIKNVDQWFNSQDLRCTVAKYAYSRPGTCLPMHTDHYPYRYHIPIKTQSGCVMIIDNVLCSMPNVGTMYRMPSTVEHTAINASDDERIHLVFDVVNI